MLHTISDYLLHELVSLVCQPIFNFGGPAQIQEVYIAYLYNEVPLTYKILHNP